MKNILCLSVIAAALLSVGCATTATADKTTAGQTITLEQALQKSAETRQKLLEARESYQNAKSAAEVASGTKSASDLVREQVQEKVDSAKAQIQAEKEAWQELLNN